MTTRDPAPTTLECPDGTILERHRDANVEIFENEASDIIIIERKNWEAVRDFFIAITEEGALL